MFCVNCGKDIQGESRFCANCGARVSAPTTANTLTSSSPASESTPVAPASQAVIEPTAESVTPSVSQTPLGNVESATPTSPESENDASTPFELTDAVGKNTAYYIGQFQRLEAGERGNFNWAAFFVGPYLCLYRRLFSCFKKYYLAPVILSFLGAGLLCAGLSRLSFVAIIVGSILSLVSSVWSLVSAVLCGKHFNKLYYAHCKAICIASDRKKYGASFKPVLIFIVTLILCGLLCALPVILLADSVNTPSQPTIRQNYPLSGEYALVADANPSEYIYLSFSDSQIELYDSHTPSDIIVAPYIIEAPDPDGYYPLYIQPVEDSEYVEFFSLLPIIDDTFSIRFAPDFIDNIAQGGEVVMVPFSAEYGFDVPSKVPGAYESEQANGISSNVAKSDTIYAIDLLGLTLEDIEAIYGTDWRYVSRDGDPGYYYYPTGCPFCFEGFDGVIDAIFPNFEYDGEIALNEYIKIGAPLVSVEARYSNDPSWLFNYFSNQYGTQVDATLTIDSARCEIYFDGIDANAKVTGFHLY